ncbi:MAG: response regulator transcription factor [Calditrichia bacterium]
MNILIIEDDKKLAQFIQKGILAEGYNANVAMDGKSGLRELETSVYDLMIVDLMLPQLDGISVIKIIRSKNQEIPILVLTARDGLDMKREAFLNGADDYLVKPFQFEELLLRIKALIRRGSNFKESHILKVADLELDLFTHEVKRAGIFIELTSREFSLLEYLMRNKGRVLSRSLLFDNVWGIGFDTDTNLVDVYIMYLRKKIDGISDKKLIHTVRGMGYVLKDRDET